MLAIFGSIIPLTLGIDGLRQVLVEGEYFTLLNWKYESIILMFYWVLGLKFAKFSLNWMEKLAREKGTLTLRWQ